MAPDLSQVRPHDLLYLGTGRQHLLGDDAPPWAHEALRGGWVVARRAAAPPGQIAIGVRGSDRSQRHGSVIAGDAVRRMVGPEDLVSGPGARDVPALTTLWSLRAGLDRSGLVWGPTGSVGFELATGTATVTSSSDLDLVLRAWQPRAVWDQLVAVASLLTAAPTRVDCQVETRWGAVALAELVGGSTDVLLRTPQGPRLVRLDTVLE